MIWFFDDHFEIPLKVENASVPIHTKKTKWTVAATEYQSQTLDFAAVVFYQRGVFRELVKNTLLNYKKLAHKFLLLR